MADIANAPVEQAAPNAGVNHAAVCRYLTQNRRQLLAMILRFESDHQAAEEILSITTVEALASLDKYKGDASVATYLCGIAQNQALTYLRKSVNRKTSAKIFYAHEIAGVDEDGEPGSVEDMESLTVDSRTPETQLEYRQLLRMVENFMPQLEERYPVAFKTWKLHRIDGLDYKEIEELTGTKPRVAFLHVFRISEALTKLMDRPAKLGRLSR